MCVKNKIFYAEVSLCASFILKDKLSKTDQAVTLHKS